MDRFWIKNIQQMRWRRRPVMRWLWGTWIAWLLLGVGAPLAGAQTSQSPDTAPATTAPIESATEQQHTPPATLDPTLTTGVTQATNEIRGRPGGELLALAVAGIMATTGLQLAHNGPAAAPGSTSAPPPASPAGPPTRRPPPVTGRGMRRTPASTPLANRPTPTRS
jgi:hypothetical protein